MPQLKREQIYTVIGLYQAGHSTTSIANAIGCHKSTISRMLASLSDDSKCSLVAAEVILHKRKLARKKRGPYKFKGQLKAACLALIKEYRAPSEVCGRLKEQGMEYVCHETLYRYIHHDGHNGGTLYKYLPRCRKNRVRRDLKAKPRGVISNPTSIIYRPEEANKPKQLGHLEADTVILKNHKGAIVTLVDRYSKMLHTCLLPDRTACRVEKALANMLKSLPYKALTITVDNGKEFANHEIITKKTGVAIYFCTPYSSWERGLNEQTNGLLRRYIPKKTSYEQVNKDYLKRATKRINSTYKACLLYKSPIEFEHQLLL